MAASFIAIAVYAKTAGPQAPPPATAGELTAPRPEGAWRIAMAVHPRCPCSRASIANLQRLLDRHAGTLTADLYVYRPATAAPEWSDTGIVRKATRLASLTAHDDVDGVVARWLGVEASGGVVLYSPEGVAVFYGGITRSRGHEGANAGIAAVEDALAGEPIDVGVPAVFGCPLFRGGDRS